MASKINTVFMQTFSWVSDSLGFHGVGFHSFEKKVETGATLLTLLKDLAKDYPDFKKMVFDPESSQLSDQVSLLLNQSLARFERVKDIPLKDKDVISLVPVLYGG